MELNLLNTILFFGIIQGAIISYLSFSRKGKTSISNRFFGGIITILTLATLGTFLGSSLDVKLFSINQQLLLVYFPYHMIMLLGPFILFYCKGLFDKDFKFTKKLTSHFYPVLLDLAPFIASLSALVIYNVGLASEKEIHGLTRALNEYNTYVDIPRFFSLTFYLIISWNYIIKIKEAADVRTYRWCKALLIGMTLITIIWIPFLLLYISPWQSTLLQTVYYFPLYYPIVGLIYFLSIKLMSQNMSLRTNQYGIVELAEKVAHLNKVVTEEKLYMYPNLKLEQLSEKVGISQKTLSFILNHHLKKGFNEFINEFRIKAALSRITTNDIEKTTLEGIALDVGFSSRSTFYRAFKKITGKHPSIYIKH